MSTTKKEKKTIKCAFCHKEMNEQYRKCPHCGGQQKEMSVFRTPECPRCKVSLRPLITDDEEYDICPDCGGMWLDRGEFHRATREQAVYQQIDVRKEYRQTPLRGPVEYVPCVRCGKLMNRKNFGRISGVMIDRCGKHGVWLDVDELEKIQLFIADGGLDRSRDREIEKNRVRIKEVATDVDEVVFSHKLLHFWNFKRWLFSGWR